MPKRKGGDGDAKRSPRYLSTLVEEEDSEEEGQQTSTDRVLDVDDSPDQDQEPEEAENDQETPGSQEEKPIDEILVPSTKSDEGETNPIKNQKEVGGEDQKDEDEDKDGDKYEHQAEKGDGEAQYNPDDLEESNGTKAEDDVDENGNGEEDEHEHEDDGAMPFLHYSRIKGSLHRTPPPTSDEATPETSGPLAKPCSCSAIGKVVLDPEVYSPSSLTSPYGVADTSALQLHGQNVLNGTRDATQNILTSDLWNQPFFVVAMGYETGGKVSLVNMKNGISVLPSLSIRDGGGDKPSVVTVSFDASGTFLGAIDEGGACTVWEFSYHPTVKSKKDLLREHTNTTSRSRNPTPQASLPASQSSAQAAAGGSLFSSFFSSLTGTPTNSASATSPPPASSATKDRTPVDHASSETENAGVFDLDGLPENIPCLGASIVQSSRVMYPKSFGRPTCLALDPSYKARREKAVAVGLADGRLFLTKRGIFQRRSDTMLYQGPATKGDKHYHGIEALAWRGSLLAWADASGIKIFDVDAMVRIAHIDRPTGARATLYPTVSNFRPSLLFETSGRLLIAWGDCLMAMIIKGAANQNDSGAAGSVLSAPTPPTAPKRRTVECVMAWELDCVACGVAPLDADHIMVLGLVPPFDDKDGETEPESDHPQEEETKLISDDNDIEVQIISRSSGTITYCDCLPMLGEDDPLAPRQKASSIQLLSTFAVPRMEDAAEVVLDQHVDIGAEEFDLTAAIFAAATDSAKQDFVDSHLEWDLKSILFDEESEPDDSGYNLRVENDTDSVDSDDYSFIQRYIPGSEIVGEQKVSNPPFIAITSQTDAVLARVSNVDDAVDHALSKSKSGLALKRALRYRRRLRTHDINELVDQYLEAVLKCSREDTHDETNGTENDPSPLSLRRLNLAVDAMPTLFGGHSDLWERWSKELETIPGALFILRKHIPVRDPVLPSRVYGRILKMLLSEVAKASKHDTSDRAIMTREGGDQFLDCLIAWGPTKVLREYIRLYRYLRENSGDKFIPENHLRSAEISLQRRYLQTAAGYLLMRPEPNTQDASDQSVVPRLETNFDDSQDSLFDVSALIKAIALSAPLVALPEEAESDSDGSNEGDDVIPLAISAVKPNNEISLDAMARLRMMQDRHDLALKCFLAIGALHSPTPLDDIEEEVIATVNEPTQSSPSNWADEPASRYKFVLDMIERHHLHQYLLDETFLLSSDSKLYLPLFALMRLVGVDQMGYFLIEHCVSPEIDESLSDSEESTRRETLPIDKVASQLSKSPSLLHWYLHLVFTRKPEIYVKFSNTANPPKSVTDLHRQHFDLYVQYAGEERDSVKALAGTETYKVETKTTLLLVFLKAALPLGGIRPVAARRMLETQRSSEGDDESDEQKSETSHSFSLELAYIIEHYFDATKSEANGILDLYLIGAESIMLAVGYAERQKQFSSMLWDRLIEYCLSSTSSDGSQFGALLEAAALSGADLARLVTKIPPGMAIEGLRGRLAAAVADYRLKLDIHDVAVSTAKSDRLSLLQEVTHRSRRGVRHQLPKPRRAKNNSRRRSGSKKLAADSQADSPPSILSPECRTKKRPDRYILAKPLPMFIGGRK